MLGAFLLLCGITFAQQPNFPSKEEITSCPQGYKKSESVEIKCGSSSEWAVINNPSIDIWNPICETRASLVCIPDEHAKSKSDKKSLDQRIDKQGSKTSEAINASPLINLLRSHRTEANRDGTSMINTQTKKPQCYTQLENVRKCHNIPVPGNRFAFTTPCYTVKEIRKYCPTGSKKTRPLQRQPQNQPVQPQRKSQLISNPRVVTPEEAKDCSKSIVYAKECKPRRTPKCEIVKKIKPGCGGKGREGKNFFSWHEGEFIGGISFVEDIHENTFNEKLRPDKERNIEKNSGHANAKNVDKANVNQEKVAPEPISFPQQEYHPAVPTFIPQILKPVQTNVVCRPKERFVRKCYRTPLFWNNQRLFSTHCEIEKETVNDCPKPKISPIESRIEEKDGGEDLINLDSMTSLDGIDDELNPESNEVNNDFRKIKEIGHLEDFQYDGQNIHEFGPSNTDTQDTDQISDLDLNISDIDMDGIDDELSSKGNEVENELRKIQESGHLDDVINDAQVIKEVVPSNTGTHDFDQKSDFEQYFNIADLNTDLPLTSLPDNTNDFITSDVVNDPNDSEKLKDDKNDETNVERNNDKFKDPQDVDWIGREKVNEKSADEKSEFDTKTRNSDKDTTNSNSKNVNKADEIEENLSLNVQESFFTCSKREVCQEILENECTSQEGPRPETVCSDISLEDCSVTPLGSAFETCDTVYNKKCSARLTDLDKRIYDETVKEKQPSVSFGQSEGDYEYETVFGDEFESLFNEKAEDDVNEVDDADKDCQVVEVESCNTQHELEIDTGRKWSCLDVPTVSCETFLNSESRMVKSCKQLKADKCKQFNAVGHIIQPKTKCKTEKITHCSEKGKPRKSGLDLVDCKLEKKHICGPHHTTQLVLNECSWNMYPVCHKIHTEETGNDGSKATRSSLNRKIRKKREVCRDVLKKKCRIVTDCS